jgi:hypothetical protein
MSPLPARKTHSSGRKSLGMRKGNTFLSVPANIASASPASPGAENPFLDTLVVDTSAHIEVSLFL